MAIPLVVEPSVPCGLKIRLLLGIPVGVSNANARLFAKRSACLRTRSVAVSLEFRFASGPFRKSYPGPLTTVILNLWSRFTRKHSA